MKKPVSSYRDGLFLLSFGQQKESGHYCPDSMKTPKTLLTNLYETTFGGYFAYCKRFRFLLGVKQGGVFFVEKKLIFLFKKFNEKKLPRVSFGNFEAIFFTTHSISNA
jgi:hypothetical protein